MDLCCLCALSEQLDTLRDGGHNAAGEPEEQLMSACALIGRFPEPVLATINSTQTEGVFYQ